MSMNLEFSKDLTLITVKVDTNNGIITNTLEKMLDSPKDILADYLGTYYSAELESDFKINLVDNKLYYKSKGYPPSPLLSFGQNLFLIYLTHVDKFEFVQDRENRVIGLYRCCDRVRKLYFSKQ
ncbi:hypothetical protein NIES4071_89410 [Calothrix sp. NIES-4071]|nr:hypothetical protein NIES4071_89410 [Calothrix sp. NIES-4071]BAZ63208.1 hypothetical protein NIES4105_89340 [Calothrix sp. NIES-4105]